MISVPPEPANPNWDAVAVSLASQANAISVAAAVVGVIIAVAGWGWAKMVAADAHATAEQEAKTMAKSCAEDYVTKWLAEQAPRIVQRHVELLNDATMGKGDDADAADEIGKEA